MTDDRIALVTGAARGIGAATVDRLCADGYRVVAVDSCGDDVVPDGVAYGLSTTADLHAVVERNDGRAVPVVADVRDPSALAAAAQLAVDRFGRLDATVAAAAVIIGGAPMWETPHEHVRTLLEVDVVGVWNTAAASIPHMLAGPDPAGCRFVAVASAAGSHGLFRLAGYTMAKHAVVGIVRGLAADLVGTGVTAVAVSPGSTGTSMLHATADIYGLGSVEEFVASSPIRRILHPDELAAAIAFCCSLPGVVLNGSVLDASAGFTG